METNSRKRLCLDINCNNIFCVTLTNLFHLLFLLVLDMEKELIQKISNNNNTKQIVDLHSQINKNMHLAHVVNLNKSDVLIASLKELSGI